MPRCREGNARHGRESTTLRPPVGAARQEQAPRGLAASEIIPETRSARLHPLVSALGSSLGLPTAHWVCTGQFRACYTQSARVADACSCAWSGPSAHPFCAPICATGQAIHPPLGQPPPGKSVKVLRDGGTGLGRLAAGARWVPKSTADIPSETGGGGGPDPTRQAIHARRDNFPAGKSAGAPVGPTLPVAGSPLAAWWKLDRHRLAEAQRIQTAARWILHASDPRFSPGRRNSIALPRAQGSELR